MKTSFTVMPFMLALLVAILNTPTDIYKICAWNVGTVKAEPWRSKLTTAIDRTTAGLTAWMARLMSLPLLANETGEAALDLLVPGASQLKALRQKSADIHNSLKALHAKASLAVTAGGEKLTEDERGKVLAFKAAAEEVKDLLADAERLNEADRAYAGRVEPDADTQASDRAAKALAGKSAKPTGFTSLAGGSISGDFLQAVYRAGVGGRVDSRLMDIQAAASGMNETVPSEGGFLVGTDQVSGVKQRLYELGEILKRVFKLPIGPNSNGVKLNVLDETSRANGSRYGGIQSYWLAEAGEKLASKPKFRQNHLELKKIIGLVYVTDELLADSVALEAWINKFLPLELKFRVEDAIINGTGAGQPLGILNSGAVVTVTRNTAGTVTFEDIVNMWSRMYAPSRANAAWIIDQSVEPALYSMSMSIGTGGAPVYMPAGGISGAPHSTLFGRPILPVEYAAALGTTGDAMLADFGEYTLIDKGGVESASSIHVRFVYDETAFRFVYRVDGAPDWSGTLTPKSGSAALSPFVVLS